jgi:hypothetical protein
MGPIVPNAAGSARKPPLRKMQANRPRFASHQALRPIFEPARDASGAPPGKSKVRDDKLCAADDLEVV